MRKLLAAVVLLSLLLVAPLVLLLSDAAARYLVGAVAQRSPLSLEYADGDLWNGLQLARATWRDGDLAVTVDTLAIEPRWDFGCFLRSTICLEAVSADAVALVLPPGEGGDSPWALPEGLRLPVRMRADSVAIGSVTLQRGEEQQALRDISGSLRLRRRGVELPRLALAHDLAQISGALSLHWTSGWPVDSALAIDLAPQLVPAEMPAQWRLALKGPLRDLTFALTTPDRPALTASGEVLLPESGPVLRIDLEAEGYGELPMVAELSPWLTLRGPLRVALSVGADGESLAVSGAVGQWAPEPLALNAQLERRGAGLRLRTLTLTDSAGESRLRASGELMEGESWAPRLAVSARGLSVPEATGVALAIDELQGQVSLAAAGDGWVWSVPGVDAELRYDGRAISAAGALRQSPDHPFFPLGSLRGKFDELPFEYRRDAAAQAALLLLRDGWQSEALALDRVEASVIPGRAGSPTVVALALGGDVSGDLEFSLAPTSSGAALSIAPFRLRVLEEIVHSNEIIEGRWSRDAARLSLAPWCLALRGLSVCSEETALGASGALTLSLEGEERFTSADETNPYSIFLQGSGALVLSWSEAGITEGRLDLTLPLVSIDPFLGAGTAPPVTWEDVALNARGDMQSQVVSLTARSERLGELDLEANVDDGALSGRVLLRALSLTALDDLVPELDINGGDLTGEIVLGGTLQAPRWNGELALTDGALGLRGEAVAVESIGMRLAGDSSAFTLTGDAQLGGGPLALEGSCCDGDALNLSLTGERNRVRLAAGLDALVTPDLRLRVESSRAFLTGDLRVHEGLFELRGPLANGVSVSRDVVRLDTPPEKPRRFALQSDVRTIIEPGFTLRTTQLETTLSGDLRFSATPSQPPQLFGELQVLGGVLRAYGQALRVDRGSVGFVGDPGNPDLNLAAVRDIRSEQLRVGVRVVGSLQAPQLNLFSEPQRSERETLSYLLRGRGPDAGAGADGTAMALALGATAINQSGLLESLNAVPGLSQVSVGAEGSDDETAATISAYVGERLFLSYGMGIYEPVNALTARLYLRSRLWLEVVSRLENSFDLYYRFDRD